MKTDVKKIISYIIPPLITVGLCYELYADVDFTEITAGIRQCNLTLVALFLSCNVMAMLIRALRWRLQLRAIDTNPPFSVMTRSIFGCYALNLVLPRLGELWRCLYISKNRQRPFSSVFGTMVADRLADTLTVFIIACGAFALASNAMLHFMQGSDFGSRILSALTSAPGIALLIIILLATIYVWKAHTPRAVKIRSFLIRTWHGFAVIFHMPHRTQWLCLTVAIWSLYFLSMYISLLAFDPTATLVRAHGAQCVLLTFVFGSLAMAIPSNGGIGPWQLAIIMSLSGIYGLGNTQSLTFATLNLAATTLLTILLGIATFATLPLSKKSHHNRQ